MKQKRAEKRKAGRTAPLGRASAGLALLFGLAWTLLFSGLGAPAQARQDPAQEEQSPPPQQWGPYRTYRQTLQPFDRSQGLITQPVQAAQRKSRGCVAADCHARIEKMHASESVRLGCTDCHGGDADASSKEAAHVAPANDELFSSAANPQQVAARWNRESADYLRFVNPGDLRVLDRTCGSLGCHVSESLRVRKSMMTHGGMLWGAALYNNGAYPLKDTHFGESYAADGTPQRLQTVPVPDEGQRLEEGIVPYLDPLPQWGVGQPGNILRIFERGGERIPEIGIPDPREEPGLPDKNLSVRGLGTDNRTDPVFLGLQKTRLLDPLLHFPGTNDQPGDYRASGCTACHVVYANDRHPDHSGPYARFGHLGRSASADAAIPKDEPGHPIRHRLTRAIPSSQCMTCHVHPGGNMETTYYGYTWWDNETDGEKMYPDQPKKLSPEEMDRIQRRNPEGSALRGLWSDPQFLAQVSELNPQLEKTQFADFHGHGWIYRAIYKQDRKGNLLDKEGNVVPWDDPQRFEKAVHLKDIHLEKGMHCVDCHFEQDVHGDGNLYNEPRAAIEIDCVDCHGGLSQRAGLRTSGFAARDGGRDLKGLFTPWARKRFEQRGETILQRSMVDPAKEWEVPQTVDTLEAADPRLASAHQAHTLRNQQGELAHDTSKMACFTCHSSWMTSCFGCHLSMKANLKKPMLHNEGATTRNWTSYNYQVLRDDVFMLGVDGTVTGNRIAPARSSSAVVVSSQNGNREWIYLGQQTISAEGYSGQAFATHVPHTVRGIGETKMCTDCHLSEDNDNNAIMAQLLMLGTNFVNFMGRYAYVATGHDGMEAVVVTERDEPQAVIGSYLHSLAYPDRYKKHLDNGRQLKEAYHHHAHHTRSIQLRGEYVYLADGKEGLRIFDVANIDHKGFSERIVTAPVSPLGQRFSVKSRDATAVAAPSTLAVDPVRIRRPENQEQPIAPIYGYIFFTDRQEGLILVGAATLLDGNPSNNFLERALTYNPDGLLDGAVNLTIAGNHVYVLCDRGVVILDFKDPLDPRQVAVIGAPLVKAPTALTVQFRYAFLTDAEGFKVLDVTDPSQPRLVEDAHVALADARNLYVARTYAYVAAGAQGLVIVDVERPEQPRLFLTYDAGGEMNDVNDVKLAMTNASLFAYVADGRHGLRVLQLTSPKKTPGNFGFSPPPSPELIATYHTHGPALAISKGLDRDRAVDESGNQVAVFGRRGARPFTLKEMQRLYLRDGEVYTVSNQPR
ncbi:MAG TPA: hypothetical protein VLU25_00265 [Acidobacteriota bacterium]|nr:hypothetical protein [Acidobacteriota bacterium]